MSTEKLSPLPETVEIAESALTLLQEYLENHRYSKIALVTDDNTRKHCYPLIRDTSQALVNINVPPGEPHKNLESCTYIWEQMTQLDLDRNSLLINLGGGVIGDMGGFCAATYKRGIDFINLPTTLLAQVDASVGGKLGIDFKGFKNHIGVFQAPKRVIIATEFLKTLPRLEMRSGFAEVLKHSLIADRQYWDQIHKYDWENQPWSAHVRHSVGVKNKVVAKDPREMGLRKILNFGHTVGHAIERHFLNYGNPLLHGEAVAIGMICETFISQQKSGLKPQEAQEVVSRILSWFGKIDISTFDLQEIAKNALQDKKNISGRIQCTLLSTLGQARYNVEISIKEILESLEFYTGLSTTP